MEEAQVSVIRFDRLGEEEFFIIATRGPPLGGAEYMMQRKLRNDESTQDQNAELLGTRGVIRSWVRPDTLVIQVQNWVKNEKDQEPQRPSG